MRKTFLMFFTLLLTMLITAGCNDSDSNAANEAKNEKQSTEEKEVKQTPQEVITQANEIMQDWPGMEYTSDITQTIHVRQDEEENSIEQKIQMDSRMTFDPVSIEVSGNSTTEDVKHPIDSYLVNNVMYTKTEGQWIGIEDMNIDQFTEQTQGQDPTEQMAKLQNTIEEDNKTSNILDMEEKGGMYVVKLRLDDNAPSEMLDAVMSQIEGSLDKGVGQLDVEDILKNMNIKQLNQTYHIDNDSFEQSKIEQQMKIEIPIEDTKMTIDMNITTDVNGKIEEPVTVPEDIKKNAEIISMEELRKAEQPRKK